MTSVPPGGKVIGVGFQKTGTTTLRAALEILGFRVCDTRPDLLRPILKGRWERVWGVLDRYDAAEDNPWPLLFREIDARYPGSRFILTVRDPESWYRSVARHIGDFREPVHEWIYGPGKGLPRDDEANTLAVYESHNAAVREWFADRPDDLLVLDFAAGDGWEPLCDFLGCEVPDAPFPHHNRTGARPAGPPSLYERARRRLKWVAKRTKNRALLWWMARAGYPGFG